MWLWHSTQGTFCTAGELVCSFTVSGGFGMREVSVYAVETWSCRTGSVPVFE